MTTTSPSDINALIRRMFHDSTADKQLKELALSKAAPAVMDALIAALDDTSLIFQKRSIVELLAELEESRVEQAIRPCHAKAQQTPKDHALKTAAALAVATLTGEPLSALLNPDEISRHQFKVLLNNKALKLYRSGAADD